MRGAHRNAKFAPDIAYPYTYLQFRVLVQEQKCSSTEDFFTLLRTLGNDYNIHIRVQKSITRLNSQLAARLNREAIN